MLRSWNFWNIGPSYISNAPIGIIGILADSGLMDQLENLVILQQQG